MSPVKAGEVYVTVRADTSGLSRQIARDVTPAATRAGATIGASLTRAGAGLSRFGSSMTRFVSLPLAAAGVASVNMAADFDQSMRNVNSIMGVSEAQLAKFGNQVINLSTRVPQTAQVLSEGLYNIASSGFKGADAMKVLEASAIAASAGMTDTETSATAVVAALNAYGLGANKATEVSDTLFQGVELGVQKFEELAWSIGNYIGAASQLAIPLEDVVGAQAAMTLTGLSASEASVSLNGILKTLLKPSTELAGVFKDLGYETGQAALESEGLQGLMGMLSAEVGNNKGRWVELFPEIRAARGAMALASDDGKLLDRVMRGMGESVGAAGKAFEEQSKGAAFQFDIAMNQLRKAGIKLGNELIPIIKADVIPVIKDAVNWFSNLSPEAKSLGVKLLGLAVVAGPMIRLAGGLASLAGGLVKVAGGLAKVVPWLLRWPKGPFPMPTPAPPVPVPTGAAVPVPGGGLGTRLANAAGRVAGPAALALAAADAWSAATGSLENYGEKTTKWIGYWQASLGNFVDIPNPFADASSDVDSFETGVMQVRRSLRGGAIDTDGARVAVEQLADAYKVELPNGVAAFVQAMVPAKGKADALHGSLEKIAKKWTATVVADVGNAIAGIAAVRAALSLVDTSVTIGVNVVGDIVGGILAEHGAFIPGAAGGGYAMHEQILRVGERSKPELILPLKDQRGHEALVGALIDAIEEVGGRRQSSAGRGDSARLEIQGFHRANLRFQQDTDWQYAQWGW